MSDIKDTLDRLDALRANVTGGVVNANGNSNADYLVALLNAYPLLRAALLEMRGENERLRDALRNVVTVSNRVDLRSTGLDRGLMASGQAAHMRSIATEALAKGGGK